jgi:thymidylate synthase (FAD)
MKLIEGYVDFNPQFTGDLDSILKHIEICGRVSYKSEDKITGDSAPKFVDMLIKRKHGAVLEHGTVYMQIPTNIDVAGKYVDDKYTVAKLIRPKDASLNYWMVTTNYRVIIENGWEDDLQYICEPTEHHAKRLTFRFICDRGVSHELVRHRIMSFIQESTRYVNYSLGKFNSTITFIKPQWLEAKSWFSQKLWKFTLWVTEKSYMWLTKKSGWKPQEARSVLPNALKTEVVVTAFIDDWIGDDETNKGFLVLRDSKNAHPDMQYLAKQVKNLIQIIKF